MAGIDWGSMPDWITTEEAAELTGFHPEYVRELARAGKIGAADLATAASICQAQPACVLEYAAATCAPNTPLHALICRAIREQSS